MVELSGEFRRRGKLVVIGGPYATLNPGDMRPHADILVRGEIEDIAEGLFSDIEAGNWRSEYEGGKPDLSRSPIPRWDLYKKGVALVGQVQTSRGCPFECEFCDVIQYLGRKQRWKEPDQVVQELEVLYRLGWRGAFLADDNFTVMRRRARALLERLAEWNRTRPSGRMGFSSQVSIDAARDSELLSMCREAGFDGVFIGIESPNEESLAETLKRQNLRIDLAAEVGKVVQAGMMVNCGMIVGFDHDDIGIFERQAEFISRLPTPLITLGLLVAPAATPLHRRMAEEGRLISHDRLGGGSFLETNIRPKLMSEAQLKSGMKWLLNRIFFPPVYAQRLKAFAETCGPRQMPRRAAPITAVELALAKRLASFGQEEQNLLNLMQRLMLRRPDLRGQISRSLFYYAQVRYMLDTNGLWDPSLGRQDLALAA